MEKEELAGFRRIGSQDLSAEAEISPRWACEQCVCGGVRREAGLALSVERRERCRTGNPGGWLAGPQRPSGDWRLLLSWWGPLGGLRGKEPSAWKIWSHSSVCCLGDMLWAWGRTQTNKLLPRAVITIWTYEFNPCNNTMKELLFSSLYRGFPGSTTDKEPSCQCKRCKRRGFDPRVRKVHWARAWTPTPVFSPENPGEQRTLAGHSPWGTKGQTPWSKWARTHTGQSVRSLHSTTQPGSSRARI